MINNYQIKFKWKEASASFLLKTMIKYIINNAYGSTIYQYDKTTQSSANNLSIIKKLCLKHLFTYDGYLKAVQKTFNKFHQLPVYLNDNMIFIPIKRVRDYDNIWINYAQVISSQKQNNKTLIIFKNYSQLEIDLKYRQWSDRIVLAEAIKAYKHSILSLWYKCKFSETISHKNERMNHQYKTLSLII